MRIEVVLIILSMATVTFLTRFGAVAIARYKQIPSHAERWLKHVPTGILTALVVPALLVPKGNYIDLSLNNHYLIAGLACAVAAYLCRNVVVTLLLGFSIMFTLRYLSP